MITVKDLKKNFEDTEVLKGISYEVGKGEKIVVVGPSGSGKSTFLRCLTLLEMPTSGKIFLEDQEITDPKTDINKIRQQNVYLTLELSRSYSKPTKVIMRI